MAAPTESRDCTEIMGYINPNPGGTAGILISKKATPEDYKKHRRMMIENKVVPFVDARTALPGGLGAWTLDKHGLMCIPPQDLPEAVDFFDEKKMMEEYVPKIIEVAKKHTGAKEGFYINHLTRVGGFNGGGGGYSRFAHTDAGPNTPPLWRKALVDKWGKTPEEAENSELLMVNVWHPMDHPAYRDPLCLLDVSTVDLKNDVAPIRYVNWKGEQTDTLREGQLVAHLVGPTYSPKHRWVFISDQQPNEAWLFKQYDTRNDGRAKCAFHNSFHDPTYDKDPSKPQRHSVEFRILLNFGVQNNQGSSSKL